jgi:amino acid transporter
LNKKLLISSLIFFILFNTTYYWESAIGSWSMLTSLILLLAFVFLAVNLLHQLFTALKEKGANRKRVILIIVMATILLVTYFYQSGLLPVGRPVLLAASREGAANCNTTFEVKSDQRFAETITCFSGSQVEGKYAKVGDTLFFHEVSKKRNGEPYYQFAIIRASRLAGPEKKSLFFYKHRLDTIPTELFITTNEMENLP